MSHSALPSTPRKVSSSIAEDADLRGRAVRLRRDDEVVDIDSLVEGELDFEGVCPSG